VLSCTVRPDPLLLFLLLLIVVTNEIYKGNFIEFNMIS
jgi:hypothetical protein